MVEDFNCWNLGGRDFMLTRCKFYVLLLYSLAIIAFTIINRFFMIALSTVGVGV